MCEPLLLFLVGILILGAMMIGLSVSKFEQQEDVAVKLQVDIGYMKSRLELQAASLATLNLEVDKLKSKIKKTEKHTVKPGKGR